MGLREKVTITLVIIALTQIACRHCMPRTPRKTSLKRSLNDLKPVKNNPVPTPYSPSRVNKKPIQSFGKAAQNGRICQNSFPKKSLYKTYNFPENEYPLDNSLRDPFHIELNFNENNHVNTLQRAPNLQSSAISDLKKEMKMKRKLLSNQQVYYGNSQLKTDMSSIKPSNPDPTRLLDSETFPEVQYPLNTMDTWGPNYWNYLPFTQEKPLHRCGQQTFNPKAKEDINKPLTRLTKAKASKYLQSYDKLKEEHRRTSTENSNRSNVGQKESTNFFTKTAKCEKVFDDFLTAGLVSNIPSNSTEMKKALISSPKITKSSENTCPVSDYPYHPMPIPYKVIEENTENICPAHEPKNYTEELQDMDNSVIAQTLQLIQDILFNDDTSSTVSTGNSKEIEKSKNTSDYTVISTNENLSTTLIDGAKSFTVSSTEELIQEVSDDAPVDNLRNNMTSLPAELIPENTTTVAGPLDVRMPILFSEPITYEALTNALNPDQTPSSNGNTVPASTSIIIIPFNNNTVGKSQMFGTSDTPIIVYLPSTQSCNNLSQSWPFNQIVASSIDRPMPNNQLYNVLSNMAPLQNDNHFSTALASELLHSNSDSGSSLLIHESLPTNSVTNNNESGPSSMREKPISEILIDKSLTDNAPFVTTSDDKLSEQPTETDDLNVNTDTLPPISDFEHPLFDFSGNDFTSLSDGPYNNIVHNELLIIASEIDSDQKILNVSSKDLFIPIQNVTSEHLHKTTSIDSVSEVSLSEIPIDIPPVALDKNFSSVTPTDSIEILKTNTLLHEYIPSLPVDTLTESLSQPIDKILLSTPLIEPPTAELPQPKQSSLSPTLPSETLSDKLPIIMDTKLPLTSVSDTTTDSAPQHIDNLPSPPILNSSPMMADMSLKTELYKMRQILDEMLSTETPTYIQPTLIDTTPLPISESNSLLLPMNETPTESLPLPATNRPIDSSRQLHETLPPISVDGTPTDPLPLPGQLVIPNKLLATGTPSLPIDNTVPPTPVSESSVDNKPYVLDNLVTPLSETDTSRTKVSPDNGVSHKIDDMPFKMDLKCPNVCEVSSDDLSLLVDDLPTKVQPEHSKNPGALTYDTPMQVVETLTPVSERPVSNLPKPADALSLPVDEVIEGASPDVPTDSIKTLMSGSIDKLLQDFSSIHETLPAGPLNEISSEGPPQKGRILQTVQKLIPDLSIPDALTNEPSSLNGYSPSRVIDKNIEFPYSTTDTKDLPLVVEHLLSPKNDVTEKSLVTDKEGQQSTYLDKTSDEVLSESTLPVLPRDNLPLPEDNMLPLTDNKPNDLSLPINKIPSTSKLPITKALLENALSDITKGGLSSVVAKALPVTPYSLLDKTLHHVDVKSPLSKTKNIPLRPVENIVPNSEHTANLIEYVPFSRKLEDTSITDLPSELPLLIDEKLKDNPYIPTDDVEDHDKNETQSLDNPTHDLPVSINKVSLLKNPTKTPSSSKLPKTKALLENVLSDITTRNFLIPVTQSLPVTSPSVIDNTLYYIESPMSHITEDNPSLPVDKILPNTSLSDHPTDNLPISTEDILPLPIDKTNTELQNLNIPTELSSPIDNLRPDIPTTSMHHKEQDEIENPSSENLTDDLSLESPMEGILSVFKDTPRDLTLPNNNKISSSSKLPITKALLENVLTDINTRGFSLPVAQSLPVTSPSVLEKTLYYVESPISHITKDNPSLPVDKTLPKTSLSDHPTDNLPISTEDTLPLPIDKTYSELQSLNIPTELSSPIDNIQPDIPIISMYDKEQDEIENPSSENLTDDLSSASPMEDILSRSKDTPSDLTLPNNKTPSSSKLPITKVLLENVLSDINTRSFSLPVAKAFPVAPRSQLDKTLYFLESPVSDMTEKNSVIPIDNFPPSTMNEDVSPRPTDETLPDNPILDIPTDELLMDKIHYSDILTDDVEDGDKSNNLTDNVEDDDEEDKSDIWSDNIEANEKSDNLTDDVEDDNEDKSDIWSDDVQTNDKSDNLTDDVEDNDEEDKSDRWSDDMEANDKSDNLTDDVEDEDEGKSENLTDDEEDKSDRWSDDMEANDKSDNLTDDGEDEGKSENLTDDIDIGDSNEVLFSEDPIDDIPSDPPLLRTKPYLTSRIPITKALLEKVLSDITDGGIHP